MFDRTDPVSRPDSLPETRVARTGRASRTLPEHRSACVEQRMAAGSTRTPHQPMPQIATPDQRKGAENSLKPTLDIGEAQPRMVFAAIKSAYDPEKLKGRMT